MKAITAPDDYRSLLAPSQRRGHWRQLAMGPL